MIKTVEETNNCIRLINSMPYNQRISRGELSRATGLSDRIMRKTIELLRKDGEFIINNQSGGGYTRLEKTAENEVKMMEWVKQEKSRAMKIIKNYMPVEYWLKGQRALF